MLQSDLTVSMNATRGDETEICWLLLRKDPEGASGDTVSFLASSPNDQEQLPPSTAAILAISLAKSVGR